VAYVNSAKIQWGLYVQFKSDEFRGIRRGFNRRDRFADALGLHAQQMAVRRGRCRTGGSEGGYVGVSSSRSRRQVFNEIAGDEHLHVERGAVAFREPVIAIGIDEVVEAFSQFDESVHQPFGNLY